MRPPPSRLAAAVACQVGVVVLLGASSALGEAIEPLNAIDTGGVVRVVGDPDATATAVVFLGHECPVSRAEIPALNALAAKYLAKGAQLFGVVSEPGIHGSDAAEFARELQVGFPVIFDASGTFATQFHPKALPEVFVVNHRLEVVYRGRIDNSYRDLGRSGAPTTHELDDALGAALADRPALAETEAVGCAFESSFSGPDAGVTFTRDIAPIVFANCTTCHRPTRVAPFSLLSYADAARHAKMIARVAARRLMPPWKPDPDFVHFRGERHLTDAEIAMLGAWAAAGAPEGDPRDLPLTPNFPDDWALGPPDLVVEMPEEFPIPASGPDVYRSFVVPSGLTGDRKVVAVDFRPSALRAVHHTLLYLDTTGAARKLDAADPGLGFTVFGGPGFPDAIGIGVWGPGVKPHALPSGMAYIAPAKSDVVFQMHYHPTGKPERDRSKLAFYFAKGPIHQVVGNLMLARFDLDIPAGQADYTKDIDITLPEAITLIGIIPHMHFLGRDMKAVATLPSGREVPLVWVKDWDFRWQNYYTYREPIPLPAGTRIRVHAHWDNSASNPDNPNQPPRRVTWGTKSTDEMFFCPLRVAARSPADILRLQRETIGEQKLWK